MENSPHSPERVRCALHSECIGVVQPNAIAEMHSAGRLLTISYKHLPLKLNIFAVFRRRALALAVGSLVVRVSRRLSKSGRDYTFWNKARLFWHTSRLFWNETRTSGREGNKMRLTESSESHWRLPRRGQKLLKRGILFPNQELLSLFRELFDTGGRKRASIRCDEGQERRANHG